MAREAFLRNLQTAARFLSPTVQVDGIRLEPEHIESVLRSEPTWLTPRAVEGFDKRDFLELPEVERAQLDRNVSAFKSIAESSQSAPSAGRDQIDAAIPVFLEILELVPPFAEGIRIYRVLKSQPFPDYVRDFAVRVDDDSTGVPSTWIWVIVEDDAVGPDFFTGLSDLRRRVGDPLRQAGIELYPYVSFRTESEQSELESVLVA